MARQVQVEFSSAVAKIKQCPAGQKPEVALAGRSNVGKSSLLNTLANKKNLARVSKIPGRTQTINFYLVNKEFFLVDLPGYGFANVPGELRVHWKHLIEEYLRQRKQLRGVLHILDIRLAPTDLDQQLFSWLGHFNIPFAIVATKADKISRSRGLKQLGEMKKVLCLPQEVPLVMFSARTGDGKQDLWRVITGWVSG